MIGLLMDLVFWALVMTMGALVAVLFLAWFVLGLWDWWVRR